MKGEMMKRIGIISFIAIFLLAAMALANDGRLKQKTSPKQQVQTVAVNQYVTHPILDAVFEGMKERLAQEQGIDIIVKNSNADAMTCRQINEQFVRQGPAVIVALGTPAAQSAVQVANGRIPVVFGAITDPVGAKLADSLEQPGGNKTGTTNRWPFSDQVRLIKQLMPQVKTVGVVVNPGEDNCNAGLEVFRTVTKEQGLTLIEIPATNSAEVKAATEVLVSKNVDVILISPSNVLFSALDSMISTAKSAGIPVIGGDESAVQRGSVATYGFSNKDVGVATAEIVLEVLKMERGRRGGRDVGSIPVARPKQNSLFVNPEALQRANITIPAELQAQLIEK